MSSVLRSVSSLLFEKEVGGNALLGFLSASFKAWSAGESRSGSSGGRDQAALEGKPALLGEVGAGAGVLSHAVHTRPPGPASASAAHRCLSIAALIPPLRVYVNSFPSKTSVAFIVSELVVCEKPHSGVLASLFLQLVPPTGQAPAS